MNDHGNAAAPSLEDVDVAVPPQVLARWAAIAGERACFNALLPSQPIRSV
ncbi:MULTISPECIES: hypothetical protein [unclassified Actinotalea]|nr:MULTISPECIES: hypothetical protein [unclassified Actinotalea]